eukprot:1725051-Amphidinium_carterae.1
MLWSLSKRRSGTRSTQGRLVSKDGSVGSGVSQQDVLPTTASSGAPPPPTHPTPGTPPPVHTVPSTPTASAHSLEHTTEAAPPVHSKVAISNCQHFPPFNGPSFVTKALWAFVLSFTGVSDLVDGLPSLWQFRRLCPQCWHVITTQTSCLFGLSLEFVAPASVLYTTHAVKLRAQLR